MVKVKPANAEALFQNWPADIGAVLLYGPNAGLIAERAAIISRSVMDGDPDDMRRTILSASQVKAGEEALIADELCAMNLMGGRRLVWLDTVADDAWSKVERALGVADPAYCLLLVTAGDLTPRSKLRQGFEKAKSAFAVACYPDDARVLERLVEKSVREAGFDIARSTTAQIASLLPEDRAAARGEIDKLLLYIADQPAGTLVDEEALAANFVDSSTVAGDGVILAALAGHVETVDNALQQLGAEESRVGFIRRALFHVRRLETVGQAITGGQRANEVIAALRPMVFFRDRPLYERAVVRWPPGRCRSLRGRLHDLEREIKTTGNNNILLTNHFMIRLAAA
ncbi:MAG: DNA polymerase III subunit delta [Pseudomonadota bacterium]